MIKYTFTEPPKTFHLSNESTVNSQLLLGVIQGGVHNVYMHLNNLTNTDTNKF